VQGSRDAAPRPLTHQNAVDHTDSVDRTHRDRTAKIALHSTSAWSESIGITGYIRSKLDTVAILERIDTRITNQFNEHCHSCFPHQHSHFAQQPHGQW
jgi:hypothetical protein